MSGNPITGNVNKYGRIGGLDKDADTAGITALAAALPSSKIASLNVSGCGLCPDGVKIVAAILDTAGVETVDLSNNRFDPSLLDGIKHKVKLNLAGCRA